MWLLRQLIYNQLLCRVQICFVTRGYRKFATFSASKEIPTTVEESVLFWLNKSTSALHTRVGVDAPVKQLTDLSELCDGVFLASAVSFYCCAELPFDGINCILLFLLPYLVSVCMLLYSRCCSVLYSASTSVWWNNVHIIISADFHFASDVVAAVFSQLSVSLPTSWSDCSQPPSTFVNRPVSVYVGL